MGELSPSNYRKSYREYGTVRYGTIWYGMVRESYRESNRSQPMDTDKLNPYDVTKYHMT